MIEVKIDMIPFGDENQRRTIEKLVIINDGSNTKRPHLGNYKIKYKNEVYEVKDHVRNEGIWKLLEKFLRVMKGERQWPKKK